MRIDMDYIRSVVEQALQERDWQKESERITKHPQNKSELLDDGGNENSPPFEDDTIKNRSKSSPPGG